MRKRIVLSKAGREVKLFAELNASRKEIIAGKGKRLTSLKELRQWD